MSCLAKQNNWVHLHGKFMKILYQLAFFSPKFDFFTLLVAFLPLFITFAVD